MTYNLTKLCRMSECSWGVTFNDHCSSFSITFIQEHLPTVNKVSGRSMKGPHLTQYFILDSASVPEFCCALGEFKEQSETPMHRYLGYKHMFAWRMGGRKALLVFSPNQVWMKGVNTFLLVWPTGLLTSLFLWLVVGSPAMTVLITLIYLKFLKLWLKLVCQFWGFVLAFCFSKLNLNNILYLML